MLYYQIPPRYVILTNFPNVCYITKFSQRMLYYQIPLAYVILQNLCPQQMLGARANGETFVSATNYQIPPTYVILPNSPNVCYITKFPQRMLYYQIPQRMLYYQIPPTYAILPNSLSVCYIT